MPRLILSDEQWPKLRKILCQHSIYDKRDLRMTVEGMLYRKKINGVCASTNWPVIAGESPIQKRSSEPSWSRVMRCSSRFQDENEARRFLAEMHERLACYGLTLHPEKMRLIEFGRYAEAQSKRGMRQFRTYGSVRGE